MVFGDLLEVLVFRVLFLGVRWVFFFENFSLFLLFLLGGGSFYINLYLLLRRRFF